MEFDGLGFTISNLYIHRLTQNYVGLFGYTQQSNIQNIGLLRCKYYWIKFYRRIRWGIIGELIFTNSYATGTVNGTDDRRFDS